MIDPQRQEAVQSAQLVVVKIGSRVLTTEEGLLDINVLKILDSNAMNFYQVGKK